MAKDENDEEWYNVVILNIARFEFAMDLVSTGMSFRQVAAAIQFAREHTKMAVLSGLNDNMVGQYTPIHGCLWEPVCKTLQT